MKVQDCRDERCPDCLTTWPAVRMEFDRIWWLICPICGAIPWRAVLTVEDYESAEAARLLSVARRHHRTDAAPERTVGR